MGYYRRQAERHTAGALLLFLGGVLLYFWPLAIRPMWLAWTIEVPWLLVTGTITALYLLGKNNIVPRRPGKAAAKSPRGK